MYRLAYAVNFLLAASAGVIFVFLADIQVLFGLSGLQVGVIAATGFASAFFASIWLAPFADRGHLVAIASAGVAATIVGNLGFVVANGFVVLVLSRALVGLGVGLFSAAARKGLIGLDTEGGGAKMGAMLSAGVFGFVCGPALGAVLEQVSFEAPFLVLAGLLGLLAFPTLKWLATAPIATAHVAARHMLPLLRRPVIQAAMLAQVLLFTNIGLFDSVTDIFLTDLGASTTAVALLLMTLGLPMAVLAGPAGKYIDGHNTHRVFVVSCLILAPVLGLYGFSTSLIMFGIVGVADGVTSAFAFPSTQIVVLEESGAAESAMGQGLLEATGQLAGAMSALVAPALYASSGPEYLYASFGLGGLVLVLVARTRLSKAAAVPAI